MEQQVSIFYFVTSKGKVKQLTAVDDDGESNIVICSGGTGYPRHKLHSTMDGAKVAKCDELRISITTLETEVARIDETIAEHQKLIDLLEDEDHV